MHANRTSASNISKGTRQQNSASFSSLNASFSHQHMDVSVLPHVQQEGLSLELALPPSSAYPRGSAAFSAAALTIPTMLAGSILPTMASPLASVINHCWRVSAEAPPPTHTHSSAALCQM